ncbi:hypothetical protein KJ652_00805 [Patescibacteria group bacterium]|nr:hypothetical protein [Patescibacteria group bacterium]
MRTINETIDGLAQAVDSSESGGDKPKRKNRKVEKAGMHIGLALHQPHEEPDFVASVYYCLKDETRQRVLVSVLQTYLPQISLNDGTSVYRYNLPSPQIWETLKLLYNDGVAEVCEAVSQIRRAIAFTMLSGAVEMDGDDSAPNHLANLKEYISESGLTASDWSAVESEITTQCTSRFRDKFKKELVGAGAER